ncbi:hypothetical protein LCGC14_2703500 [marine sediment metagenome]|uniref:Uncharacterized protein n=1 Tax=marine sediment metagenome TaxID=412755 RepID=A0A0F9C702_9ZZZZ
MKTGQLILLLVTVAILGSAITLLSHSDNAHLDAKEIDARPKIDGVCDECNLILPYAETSRLRFCEGHEHRITGSGGEALQISGSNGCGEGIRIYTPEYMRSQLKEAITITNPNETILLQNYELLKATLFCNCDPKLRAVTTCTVYGCDGKDCTLCVECGKKVEL